MELVPYGNQGQVVSGKNQSTDFHMYDTLEIKSFFHTGVCELTCMCFIRKAFKRTCCRFFLTKSDKHYLHSFKQYSDATQVW